MIKIAAISINKTSLKGFMRYKKILSKYGYDLQIIHEERINSSMDQTLILKDLPLKPNEFKVKMKRKMLKKLSKYNILLKPLFRLTILFYWVFYLLILRKKLRAYFIKEQINFLFLYGDRSIGLETEALFVAKKIGIKSIIAPIVIPASKKNLLKNRGLDKIPSFIDNFLFSRYYLYGPYGTLASLICNYPNYNLWNIGSSEVDRVCVFNNNLKKTYIKNGIDEKKIIVTGSLDIAESFDNKSFSISSREKDFILINLPTLYEHNFYDYHFSKKLQLDIIRTSKKASDQFGLGLVVNLHPKQNKKNYFWLKEFEVIISKNKLVDDLINSTCYITGQASSTIAFSDELRKYCIVCGWYGLESNYDCEKSEFIFEIINYDLLEEIYFAVIKKAIKNKTVTNFNYNINEHINNLLSGL